MKKPKDIKIKAIAVVITLLLALLFIKGYMGEKNTKGIVEYDSLNSLRQHVTSTIEIPTLLDSCTNIKADIIAGVIVEVHSDEMEFRAVDWVNDKADPLGIYDKPEKEQNDVEYKRLDDNESLDITFFKYRLYNDYTVVNWVKQGMAYEIKFNSIVDMQTALNSLALNIDGLTLIEHDNTESIEDNTESAESSTEIAESNTENWEYIKSKNIKYSVPNKEYIRKIYSADEVIYYTIDNHNILAVVYNNVDKYIKEYSKDTNYCEFNGVYFMYSTVNPFDEGTDSFNNYNDFMSTMSDILSSINNIE